MIITRLASQIVPGDTLTDSEGRYSRTVVEVDPFSNIHGKIIFRTAIAEGRKATGTTVLDADSPVQIMR